ncbi:Box C/D snoRNA accumulation [Tilletia horrida]|uniref:Box C/D snoRNA accumulation n=1 Tax=Tilletia horrida TaxID=155126 RepID=A0AAN6GID7_9BASI|nr:Box C/D snoRNA accumulation [Tilletia horrida]KAK0560160.1 Box C/D snoRNA accumulation [Tilletia horrida]
MPAACVSTCEECSQRAKYTCPSCGAHTCSLPCTKQHKAKTCVKDADVPASNTSSGSKVKSASPSTSSRRPLPAKRKAHDFIPLAEYGEQDLLSDYKFLSQVSRVAEQAGRDLLRSRVVRAGARGSVVPLTNAAQNALGAVASAAAIPGLKNDFNQQPPNQPMSPAQQRLEALKKQLAYRKIPVMFLPENMGRRKLNQSSWRGREKEMTFTVEVKFPFSLRSVKGKGKALDAAPSSDGASNIQEATKWNQTSFVIPLASGSAGILNLLGSQVLQKGGVDSSHFTRSGKRRRKDKPQDASSDAAKEISWATVDAAFWAELGLRPDEDALAEGTDGDSSTFFPTGTHFLIPLFPIKLRNESSLKYLQWYARHGKAAEEEEARRREAGEENGTADKCGAALDPSTGERTRDNGWATVQQHRDLNRAQSQAQQEVTPIMPTEYAYDPSWYDYGSAYAYGQEAYAYSYGYDGYGHAYGYYPSYQQPAAPVAAVPTPLFSASLLQSLSQKVDNIQQQRNQPQWNDQGHTLIGDAQDHAPAVVMHSDAMDALPANQDSTTAPSTVQPEPNARSEKPAPEQPKKTFLEVESDTELTVEEVLRKIPWGWGLVEFPTVEIWPETEYKSELDQGRIQVLPLRDSSTEAGDNLKGAAEKVPQQDTAQPQSSTSGQAGSQSAAAATQGENAPAAPPTTSSSVQFKSMSHTGPINGGRIGNRQAAVTLVSYGSSDEDESDDDDDGPPEEISTKPQAPAHVEEAATAKLNTTTEPSADESERQVEAPTEETAESTTAEAETEKQDEEMEAEHPSAGGGSLAALAQQLGWGAQTKP